VFDPAAGALLMNRTWGSNFHFITIHSRPTEYSFTLLIVLMIESSTVKMSASTLSK
jgi:hypothetical protein